MGRFAVLQATCAERSQRTLLVECQLAQEQLNGQRTCMHLLPARAVTSVVANLAAT
jgi:hypothetical protein